jgi:hypothetical protein
MKGKESFLASRKGLSPPSLYNPEYVTNLVDRWDARAPTIVDVVCVVQHRKPFSSKCAAVRVQLSAPVRTDTAVIFIVT